MNIHRVETRRGRAVLVGLSAAMGGSSKELIESLAETQEQAEAIYNAELARQSFRGNGDL